MPDKLQEKLEWELLKRGLSQAVDSAAASLSSAADETLDSLERRLLGKESPKSEDALDRVREHYGVSPQAPEPNVDPLEKVRAQLEALKAQKGAVKEAVPETPRETAPPVNDALAQAKAQLEALKKARNSPDNEPKKRTL